MSPEAFTTEVHRLDSARNRALDELLNLCRTVVPLLKDHGMPTVSEQLAAKIFEIDANAQELANLLRENPQTFVELLRRARPGGAV